MRSQSDQAQARETERIVYAVAHTYWRELRVKVPVEELESLAAQGVARARREWNGQGKFGPFAAQRARWACIDGMRAAARQAGRGEKQEDLLATAALSGACTDVPEQSRGDAGQIRDVLRRAAAAFDLELDAVEALPGAGAEEVERDAERIRLRRAVETLPDPGRAVVERHYYEGETFEDMAKELQIPRSTLSDIHQRAVMRLWQMFAPPREPDGDSGAPPG